jgi:hypothetical protein
MTVAKLEFDADIYSCLAIEKGCYRLSDVLSGIVRKEGKNYSVEITFLGKEKTQEGIEAVPLLAELTLPN